MRLVNDLDKFQDVFHGVVPYAGDVPKGFFVDFLGRLTDASFHGTQVAGGLDPESCGGEFVRTSLPQLPDGEWWFESVDWLEAARKASGHFVMVTLGACYGAQAVGAVLALRQLNPLPYFLVAVEPVAENVAWTAKHMRDNGIDPEQQWILQTALSDHNEPVFFPVGAPGTSGNCFSTNEAVAREEYLQELMTGDIREALRNLVLRQSTGIGKKLSPAEEEWGEIKLLSAMTLKDVLAPLGIVDYLEADIQESERIVFPPCIDFLSSRVRRAHIGTHGRKVHQHIHELFATAGWEIVFSYEPESKFQTDFGAFATNDGVLTALNPFLDGAPRPASQGLATHRHKVTTVPEQHRATHRRGPGWSWDAVSSDITERVKATLPPPARAALGRLKAVLTGSSLSTPVNEVERTTGHASAALPSGQNLFGTTRRSTPRVHVYSPPVVALPYPLLDLHREDLGMGEALSSPEFQRCEAFFNHDSIRPPALLSSVSQAVLYTLVRNLKPEMVVEIGTYRAGTAQVISRAIQANGTGRLHTVDPYNAEIISEILAQWPDELKPFVQHHSIDSMAFFAFLLAEDLRPGLAFIDGNHDYEFVKFDIDCCARVLSPGGFMVIDNVDQSGPFFALRDFLDRNPGWRDIGGGSERFRKGRAFDPERTGVPGTNFTILVGPDEVRVGTRPLTWGQAEWPEGAAFNRVVVEPSRPANGTLYVQCVFRAFPSSAVPSEDATESSVEIDGRTGPVTVPVSPGWPDDAEGRRTVEISAQLGWAGRADVGL